MDPFFQKIRNIQKKERSTGILSEIDNEFYEESSKYLRKLIKSVDKNPFSLDSYQLHDAQRIIVEICEKREFKIISSALANVQKSHDIIKGHSKEHWLDTTPQNTTPQEEQLYTDIIKIILNHRKELMENVYNKKEEITETQINNTTNPTKEITSKQEPTTSNNSSSKPKHDPLKINNIEEIADLSFITNQIKEEPEPKLNSNDINKIFGTEPKTGHKLEPKTESRTEHESTQPKEPEPKTEENTTTKSTISTEEIAIIKKGTLWRTTLTSTSSPCCPPTTW